MNTPTSTLNAPLDPNGVSFRAAAAWSFVLNGGRQLTSVVVTLVVARLVGPEAYGIAGLATVYVLFVQMIMQQGLGPAIVQRRDLRAEHLDTAFWIVTASSVVLMGASIALSGWWADVSDIPKLQDVTIVLSLTLPVRALGAVQDALFRRRMDFRTLAIRTNVAVVAGGCTGVALALAGAGVWALVAQQVVMVTLEVVIVWLASHWRPGTRFSKTCARELLRFSLPSTLATFGVFLGARIDVVMIGLFLGPVAVGLYLLADRIVTMIVDALINSVQNASLPEFSRYQTDRAMLGERARAILRMCGFLALPALGVLAGTAESLSALVGHDWVDASRAMQFMCIVGAARVLTSFTGPMLQAIGRPGALAAIVWISAAASAAVFVTAGALLRDAAIDTQLVGMAASRALLFVAFAATNLYIIVMIGRVSATCLLRPVAPAFVAGIAAAAVGIGLHSAGFAEGLPAAVRAAVVGFACGVAAVGVLIVAAGPSVVRGRLRESTLAIRGAR